MLAASGLRFEDSAFWVRHRNREYGPFDYEWARDLGGIELRYGEHKFGEFCSVDEITADLKEFRLPMRVVEVTAVVCGSILLGLLSGFNTFEKRRLVIENLRIHGLDRYSRCIDGWT